MKNVKNIIGPFLGFLFAISAATAATQEITSRQVKDSTLVNADISGSAAIATNKLSEGADFLQKDSAVAWTIDQNAGGQKLTNLGTPTSSTDAATKGYADTLIEGLSWKDSVRASTTGAGTLATDFENADTLDGITLATGDRILIKDQAAGEENGIYTVNASGAPTRASDFNSAIEVEGGAVFVEEGTANANEMYTQTADNVTLSTTALTFVQFSSTTDIVAGTGLTKTGSTINANATDTSITMNADDFGVNASNGLEISSGLKVKSDTTGGANLAKVVNVAANGVSIRVDGTTVGENGNNRLYIVSAGVTEDQLSASVSGAGLTGGAGSALAVGAGTGITVNANDVAVNSATVLFRADVIANEVPNESCNGSTTAFTVDNTISQLWTLTINGMEQRPTTDFTVSGSTITLTTACDTGDSILVDYTK